MGAINKKVVKIYIAPVDTNPSAVVASQLISGQIKSYAKSGGESPTDTVQVFGGTVSLEKPTTLMNVEFDIVPELSSADTWDKLIYGTVGGVYTSNSSAAMKAIFIEASDGTNKKAWAFNNCDAISWDFDHNADDNQSGKFKFSLSPSTSVGVANFQTFATALTSLPAWTTLTS